MLNGVRHMGSLDKLYYRRMKKTVISLVAGVVLGTGVLGINETHFPLIQTPMAEAKTKTVYIVTASALNVRKSATTRSKRIGLVYKGNHLSVLGKTSNGWYKINYKGKTGYVSGKYVKAVKSTSTTSKTKILNVPIIKQRPELPSGCEATALAMALNYYHIKVSKITIAKQMPYDRTPLKRYSNGQIKIWGDPSKGFVGTPFGNGYTIYPNALKKTADRYRKSTDLTGSDFSKVEQAVKSGKPTLVWFTINYKMPLKRYWKTLTGKTIYAPHPLHCIVVTGVDSKYVYFNDSESGRKNVKLAKSQFIKVYNAMGKRALVIN